MKDIFDQIKAGYDIAAGKCDLTTKDLEAIKKRLKEDPEYNDIFALMDLYHAGVYRGYNIRKNEEKK